MSVSAGAGDDTINVGSQAPLVGGLMDGIQVALAIDGGLGTDTVVVDDTGDTTGNTGTLTATQLTGLGMTVGISYAAVEQLNVGLGSGNDTFNIQTIGNAVSVSTGAGDDTINVGSQAPLVGGLMDGIQAALVIDLGLGTDTVAVDDTGDTTGNTGTLTATQLTGLGMTVGITYAAVEQLNVGLGSGNDTFNIQTIGNAVSVSTGAGDDTINVGSQAPLVGGLMDGIQAALVIDGGLGTDTVVVDDTGDITANTGTLTATQLTGLGMTVGITYADIDQLNVALGSGNDTFNIQTIGNAVSVSAGAGDDTINVGSQAPLVGGLMDGIQVALAIDGGLGTDTVVVDDTGDTTANTGTLTATQLTGLGMTAGISYGAVEQLNVGLGSGNDTFNIQTIGNAVAVSTGAGDDTINVGSQAPGIGSIVDGIQAELVIGGGPGNDTVRVDDTGDTTANTGTLTAGTLSGLGMSVGIAYADVESLEVFLGSGNDTFAVTGAMKRADGFQTITSLSTGAGNDSVTVSLDAAVDGFFSLNTEAGNDVVNAGSSTLPLVIFGGEGDDTITGGQGQDIIFADRGRVDYRDGTGKLVTRLGLGLAERHVLGASDPELSTVDVPNRQTDGLAHTPSQANTRDPAIGGADSVDAGPVMTSCSAAAVAISCREATEATSCSVITEW